MVQPPGDLVYLSERKLRNLAEHFGIDTGWFEINLSTTRTGRAKLPLVPGTGISTSIDRTARRVDPEQGGHAIRRLLEQVVAALEEDRPLAQLDADDAGVGGEAPPLRQGGWFRFRRELRFGVGAADSDQSVRALVFVDAEAVDHDDGFSAGLLMTGAPHHLQEPYCYDDPSDVPGSRSGSQTDELFHWLQAARHTTDTDRCAGLEGPAAALFGTNPVQDREWIANDMYRLLADDGWLATHPRFPAISRSAACEGVAIATLIATHAFTVVMGTPLYVRVRFPGAEEPFPPPEVPAQRTGQWRRLLRPRA